MFKHTVKFAAFILAVTVLALSLCSCLFRIPSGKDIEKELNSAFSELLSELENYNETESGPISDTEAGAKTETEVKENTPAEKTTIDEDGYYYDVKNVIIYLYTYGKLPSNYITKSEAGDLGWEGGSVEKFRKGAAIGGDSFGNREGLLPAADGRKYTECDIDTAGESSRGAKRLIFSNDGLFFYTDDHYESFTELYVNDKGEVVQK